MLRLKVHQLYYKFLIAQVHRAAAEARIKASQDLQSERVQQVKYGSVLEENLIESRAATVAGKTGTADYRLAALRPQATTQRCHGTATHNGVGSRSDTAEVQPACARETCLAEALASHPEISRSAQRSGQSECRAFAWQKRTSMSRMWTPLLVTATKTTFHFSPVISARSVFTSATTSSTRVASVRCFASAKLSCRRRKKILPGVTDEVELAVQTAYNKLERTQQMRKVSEEVLALRTESNRVLRQELVRGEALISQANMATAQELDARTLLLQSQLDYTQANDEIIHALGRTPE